MNIPILQVDLHSVELSMGSLTDGKTTDPFVAEAAKIFMVPEGQVTDKQRQYAKAMAYRMAYSTTVLYGR